LKSSLKDRIKGRLPDRDRIVRAAKVQLISPIRAVLGPQVGELVAGLVALALFFAVIWILTFPITELPKWLQAGQIFNPDMPPQTALEIYRGMMQVDSVVIGFVALIATYLLTDIRRAYRGLPKIPPMQAEKRERAIGKLESRRSYALLATSLTIGSFVVSILSTLRSMSYLTSIVAVQDFFVPLLFMIYGMTGAFVLLMLSTGLAIE
jgi:hypothetical protein